MPSGRGRMAYRTDHAEDTKAKEGGGEEGGARLRAEAEWRAVLTTRRLRKRNGGDGEGWRGGEEEWRVGGGDEEARRLHGCSVVTARLQGSSRRVSRRYG